MRMYFHYRRTRLYQWMASFSIKSTQIILFRHLRLIPNMLLFTIESSGVYIHNVVLKPWRISRNWEVAVSILLCSLSLESDVAMDRWYHQIFFICYVIHAYIQIRNGAKGYFTCAVYFYVYICAFILMASENLK
jgi:hypothetical protein